MQLISLGLAVTTDRSFLLDDRLPSEMAARWGRTVGIPDGAALSSHGVDGGFSVRGAVDAAPERQPELIANATRALVTVLAAEGIRVLAWTSVESMTFDETMRRMRNVSFPELVDAGRFAELCGISRSRIHALAAASRRAREAGRHHRFPRPVVPGYWLRSTADAFARRRQTGPGPTRMTRTERFLDHLAAREKARCEGRPVPEVDWSLLPSTMEESLEDNGCTPGKARAVARGDRISERDATSDRPTPAG